MTQAITRRFRGLRDDEGIALVTVLGVMFVVMALLLTMLAIVLRDATPAREDQDKQAAVAAAQAGIDDYLARLQANSNYATLQTDPTNPAMTAEGREVPGGVTGATYRYEVLTTALNSGDGSAVVKVTGTVNGQSRTLTTTFRPRGFLDFIYLTDKENLAPRYYTGGRTACTQRWWQGRSGNSNSCVEIGFAGNDVITGPMHTNDTPNLNDKGVKFDGDSTTSTEYRGAQCRGTQCYRHNSNGWRWPATWAADSTTFSGSVPAHSQVVGIPNANTELKAKAQDSSLNGCYFTGATHISFNGTQLTVYSPSTRTNTCGFNAANRGNVQTLTVPDGNVIYVDSTSATCSNRDTQQNSGKLSQVTGNSNSSYPRPSTHNDYERHLTSSDNTTLLSPDYGCGQGNLYVQGEVNGKVTLASQSDIIVTGDLTLAVDPMVNRTSDDIIGLIPNGSVWIYHPVSNRGSEYLSDTQRVNRVDAAILAVSQSFIVQNYDRGTTRGLGDLKVVGAISQQYRGPVGTANGTGYIKDYIYDPRYATGAISPPFFLTPTSGAWVPSRIVEG